MIILFRLAAVASVWALDGCSVAQRHFLFFPTHRNETNGLSKWIGNGSAIGCARVVVNPRNVWLMLHGNAGQAADRVYALPAFSPRDAVYILEYPGYGLRPGTPSPRSFDTAAAAAYRILRTIFPRKPICVVGESIGSGPACRLARERPAPDKIVLVTPFDDLNCVAAEYAPHRVVSLFLGRTWNNIEALSAYKGPVEIFGAADDRVIPVSHARALAANVPQAKFHLIPGGHNDWAERRDVRFRYP